MGHSWQCYNINSSSVDAVGVHSGLKGFICSHADMQSFRKHKTRRSAQLRTPLHK